MFRCIPYDESMQEAWDRFALTQGTVYHTSAFRQVLIESFGYRCLYHAVVNEAGHICAILPFVTGRNLSMRRVGVSLPFINYSDICADSEDAREFGVEAVMQLQKQHGLGYAELRLMEHHLDRTDWRVTTDNYTFLLPLQESEDQVLALSSGSNRNHIRKVYKNGWFTVSFDLAHLEAFYRIYVRRMKQLGSPAPDIRYFRSFFDRLPDNSHLLTVVDKETGEVVGGMLLITSPSNETLYYPYGANLSEYNGKYLNNFMYWEAVRFGIRHKLKILDLGRSPAGSGTYKYKLQFGAVPVPLQYAVYDGGSGRKAGLPDKNKLQLFIELWKVAPAVLTGIAGRKLIKYLMP